LDLSILINFVGLSHITDHSLTSYFENRVHRVFVKSL